MWKKISEMRLFFETATANMWNTNKERHRSRKTKKEIKEMATSNKYRYYTVNTTKVVKALNQRDAIVAASRASKVPNTWVLSTDQWAQRVPAETAHMLSAD